MEHRTPCMHILCPYKHPQPPYAVKRSKQFFSESSQAAYQIRRECSIESHSSKSSVLTHTLGPGVDSKGQNFFCSEICQVAYQIRRGWSI